MIDCKIWQCLKQMKWNFFEVLLIVCIMNVAMCLCAQPEEGSVLWRANEYFSQSFYEASRRNIDQSQIYADSMLLLYSELGDKVGIAQYDFLLGTIERAQGNHRNALEHFTTYQEQVYALRDTSRLASVHYQLGIIHEALGNLDDAIEHQYLSIGYYESQGNIAHTNDGLNNLGSIYRKMKLYEKSEELFLRSLKVNQDFESVVGQATNHVNLGNLYGEQGEDARAIEHFEQAIYFDSLDNYDYGLAYDYENIGNLFFRQERYQESLREHQKALKIRRGQPGKQELATSYQKLGEVMTALGYPDRSLLYCDSALDFARQSETLEVIRDIARTKATAYGELGTFRQAYKQEQLYADLQDSILNREITNSINELNTRYETERKEKEIALLNADRLLAETKLSAARKLLVGSLIAALVFSGLLFVVLRLWSKTKNQNVLIQRSLNEKDILLREIHHRVKNNLQFISSLLGLQTEHVNDAVALGALQEGQDRVQSMALIHQNLYQDDNLTGVHVKDYFVKLIRSLFDSYNIRKDQIDLDLEIEDLNLDVDTVVPIGLVVNELVSNCLKYAFTGREKGLIKVALKKDGAGLRLIVSDNGRGISDEEKKMLGSSFGHRLIRVFQEQLDADLKIDGSIGTVVSLYIRKFELV